MYDPAFNIKSGNLCLSHLLWNNLEHCQFLAKLENTLGVPNGRPYKDNTRPLENAKEKLHHAYQVNQRGEYCEGIYLISLKTTTTSLSASTGLKNAGYNNQQCRTEEDAVMIGCISLTDWNRWIPTHSMELFVSILPEYQGQERGLEATRALLQFAKQKYGVTEIWAFIHFVGCIGAPRSFMDKIGLQDKGWARRYGLPGVIYATSKMNKEAIMAEGSPIQYDENLMDLSA
ncbi:hypothetical protein N7462_001262 [Penicillium macrosclerotiorum]|uniref:uncharacterized protein n=1 Tax=Penicillium macrosclerotiorum TaxID=303699 RepID=UPI002546686B|nr:uncharacterized protein N7462_001262 [Penicillium macrosclerotiorum]KAJ5691839.1 hypothetical protein N7462_001262 [Penicillium macrosclerotiorum]